MPSTNKGPLAAIVGGFGLLALPVGCETFGPAFDAEGRPQGIVAPIAQGANALGAVPVVADPLSAIPGSVGDTAKIVADVTHSVSVAMRNELAVLRAEVAAGHRVDQSQAALQAIATGIGAGITALGAAGMRRRQQGGTP